MNTQAKLAEAHLIQAGLAYYRATLQVQTAQTQCEVEAYESLLAQDDAQNAYLEYQQTASKTATRKPGKLDE